EPAGLLVEQQRSLGPAVPEGERRLRGLLGQLVTLRVRCEFLLAVVAWRLPVAGGDDVPGHPPVADVVEGGDAASQVVGLDEGGGDRADQSRVARVRGDCREKGE